MSINIKYHIKANNIQDIVDKISTELTNHGFNVLTIINFSDKIKNKINKTIPNTIILGVCNPSIAYELYLITPDFLSLIPCNIVIRQLQQTNYVIEIIKPLEMVKILNNKQINNIVQQIEHKLYTIFDQLF